MLWIVKKIAGVVGSGARAFVALVGIAGISLALANYAVTQGAGTNFGSVVVAGVHYAQQLICDVATPSQCASVSAGGAVKVDNSAVTQPVSAVSWPLPSGAATASGVASIVTALGSPFQAGGSIGNTSFGISGTLPAFAATPTFNLGTLNGAALDTSVQSILTTLGVVGANPAANTIGDRLKTINATLGAPFQAGGSIGNSSFGATQSGTWTVQPGNTPNTTPWLMTPTPTAGQGCTPYHLSGGTAASNNSTNVKNAAGTLCDMMVINTTVTLYYLKLYDSSSAPTCSSATNLKHVYPLPYGPSNVGAGIARNIAMGEAYANGIGFCVTAGGGDTDNTSAATGLYVEASYK